MVRRRDRRSLGPMAMRGASRLLAAAAACATLAGCGGGGAAGPPRGRTVFAQACSACHSLSGADDPRRQGGDLLAFHASRTQMTQLTDEMPVRHPLTDPELAAVVSYVMGVEQRGSR
jgi:mono/diheme cytochrome c family protein